jgi:hypothetical protein
LSTDATKTQTPRDTSRESLHCLMVVALSAAAMIGISWGVMTAVSVENGWLHQATQAAAAEINSQMMSAYND